MATIYKIGEAAALLNLKTYVLRFWETEFPEIAPRRTAKGQRLYTEAHLALLDRIRYLLHERGLTIGGARKVLDEERARNVKYVFGAHGAVKGLDAETRAERPATAAATAATSEAQPEQKTARQKDGGTNAPEITELPAATEAKGAPDEADAPAAPEEESEFDELDEPAEAGEADEDGELDDDDEAREYLLSADQPPAFYNDPAQYNLPGLAPLATGVFIKAPHRILDSGSVEGYGGGESAPLAKQDGPQESPRGMMPLFAVARAAFMAGKAAAAQDADQGGGNFIQPGPSLAGGQPAPVTDDELKAIAGELEAIAELLRAPANSAKGSPA